MVLNSDYYLFFSTPMLCNDRMKHGYQKLVTIDTSDDIDKFLTNHTWLEIVDFLFSHSFTEALKLLGYRKICSRGEIMVLPD